MPKKSFNILHALPDFFTVLRIPIGIAIALTGIFFGRNGVVIAYWLLLGGWTTDIFDGSIARKVGKGETWIGNNDILFDSIMLLGVIFYLGYSGFISIIPAVVSSVLLFYVNVFPHTSHQTKLIIESPITCITFPFLLYLAWNPLVIAVTTAWTVLNILHDIDRAMAIKKTWQDIIISRYETLRSYSWRTNLTGLLLIVGFVLGDTMLLLRSRIDHRISDSLLGLAIAMFLIGVWALWLGRKNQSKKPEE